MIAIMGGAYPNSTALGTFNFNCGRVTIIIIDHHHRNDNDPGDYDENELACLYKYHDDQLQKCDHRHHPEHLQFLMGDPLECEGSAKNAISMLPPEVIINIIIIIITWHMPAFARQCLGWIVGW